MHETLFTQQSRNIAYHQTQGAQPGVVFLGGFHSDMSGTKALHLQDWAERTGRAFLRFDYSGHGASAGEFLDGSIGEWTDDAKAVVELLTAGPQILVGSSMGGWIALLLARVIPERIAGIIGIAAAPDFTEDSMWAGFSDLERHQMAANDKVERVAEFSDGPLIITRKLIEDGRRHLVLRSGLDLQIPLRLLHGSEDAEVSVATGMRLLDHLNGPDMRLTIVKGANHRFSSPACLAMMTGAIEEILRGGRDAAHG